MTVVLAGCGDLGTEAGLRFAAAGHRVLGLRRSPQHLPEAITGLPVDLATERPDLPDDTEVVVVALTADRRDADGYRRTYLDGMTNTLDALDRRGLRPRLLFVSSTAVYGVDDGSEIDEDTPTEPSSATGRVIVETERAMHARRPDAVSLRLAGIYGPGRTSLIDQVRDGSARVPDTPRHTNRIHRDDAAAAIVHLTTAVGEPAPVYLGVDDRPVERAEVLRFLADELGAPHPPVTSGGATRGGDKLCRNDRLRATGFTFAHPTYREGYRAVLAGHGVRHR